jgi:hypothetical protein
VPAQARISILIKKDFAGIKVTRDTIPRRGAVQPKLDTGATWRQTLSIEKAVAKWRFTV